MDKNVLSFLMMQGNGGNSNDILPLLLMQQLSGSADAGGEGVLNNEVLSVLMYRPFGQRMINQFAAKIGEMPKDRIYKLLAALALDAVSKNQKDKLGEILTLAAHSSILDMFGGPVLGVGGVVNNKNKENAIGSVGATTIGTAKKSAKDKAKELELESGRKEKEWGEKSKLLINPRFVVE